MSNDDTGDTEENIDEPEHGKKTQLDGHDTVCSCMGMDSSDATVRQMVTGSQSAARDLLLLKKAAVGIEPTNKGFAEIGL